MKFLYSDTQDYVDPKYDFIKDRNAPGRKRYWDDMYAHEMMDPVPYDGLLMSMSAIRQADGVASSKVRYSTSEEQRLLRDGARRFLRFGGPGLKDLMLMGDCGAFAYVEHDRPAYSPDEVVEFYADAGFSHGVSPDHIIFDCNVANPPRTSMASQIGERFDITLENASKFIKRAKKEGMPFEPMGAVQGWSPQEHGAAAVKLEKMGYKYLAIGGLVPLKVDVIHQVLSTLRQALDPSTNIHLLGFAKAEQIHEFVRYRIASFDSTSPLIRAFKDAKANYYIESPGGGLEYYAAIRIPQAMENPRLMQGVKRGMFDAEDLQKKEERALSALRKFDKVGGKVEGALEAVMDYHRFLTVADAEDDDAHERSLARTRELMRRTLEDKPWKRCKCSICSTAGVEVIIFRSSNRNKRRGFHNLGVYHKHLKNTLERQQ